MKSPSSRYDLPLLAAIAATRFLFRSHYLYDLDSVNFALALRHFDPTVYQPHPPGYFLYVCLGRVVTHLLPDPNNALVAISIGASVGAAWMIYLLTKAWFGQGPATFSLVLFLVSPLAWFHGIVALTYIVEAFFSGLVGYLCWRVWRGESGLVVAASAAYAVAAGFRPSAALFLGPLWLLALWRSRGIHRLLGVAAAAALVLAWLIPMLHASGGAAAYFAALGQAWRAVPARRTTLQSPLLAVARMITIVWVFVLCMGSAALLVFHRGTKPEPGPAASRTPEGSVAGRLPLLFFWTWITPGLLFFSFVFFNYVNSGYLLVLCPPVFAWLSSSGYSFLTADGPRGRYAIVFTGACANIVLFLVAPLYCTYNGVVAFERDITRIQNTLARSCDPATTVIVAFDAHFLGFRHAGYYLPKFTVVQYPEASYADGKEVFLMRDGHTEVLNRFSLKQFRDYVFFPLPEGTEYHQYLDGVLQKLAGAAHPVTFENLQTFSGPVSALPLLFSATLSTQDHP